MNDPVAVCFADGCRSHCLYQVGDGATDFSPTPDQSRAIVRESYSVASTLLVQFSVDSFDQTDEMAAILASKYPTGWCC